MKNLKFIAGFSIFGFLLSIFSSFHTVARAPAARFFIALGFAAGFGVLAVLIQLVASKFVFAENTAENSEATGKNAQNPSGSQPVDIVIQDEDLPAEDGGPQFFVGSNHQMLNNEDLQNVQKVSPEPQNSSGGQVATESLGSAQSQSTDAAQQVKNENFSSGNSGFVPLNFAENPSNISSVESKSVDEIKADEKKLKAEPLPSFNDSNDSENSSETLDVLPDLENLSETQPSGNSENSGFAENSNFSENKDINSTSGDGSSKEKTGGQDVELMAKAISTLLSKDK